MINPGNSVVGGPLNATTDTTENANAPQPGAGRGFLPPSPARNLGSSAYEPIPVDPADTETKAVSRD